MGQEKVIVHTIIQLVSRELVDLRPGSVVGSIVVLCELMDPSGEVLIGGVSDGVTRQDELRLLASRLQMLADDADGQLDTGSSEDIR